MKNKKTIIYILIITTLFFTGIETTFACTPVYRTPQESFNNANSVFSGKVISIATSTEVIVGEGESSRMKTSTMVFKVLKYWKGNPAEYVTLKSTALDGYSCPIFIPKSVGGEYLVYAYKDTSSNFYFINYTEIKEIVSANADLVFLGNGLTLSKVIKTAPVVKTSPVIVPISDFQSKTNEAQIVTDNKVKQNFIQKIIYWFKNLFS